MRYRCEGHACTSGRHCTTNCSKNEAGADAVAEITFEPADDEDDDDDVDSSTETEALPAASFCECYSYPICNQPTKQRQS